MISASLPGCVGVELDSEYARYGGGFLDPPQTGPVAPYVGAVLAVMPSSALPELDQAGATGSHVYSEDDLATRIRKSAARSTSAQVRGLDFEGLRDVPECNDEWTRSFVEEASDDLLPAVGTAFWVSPTRVATAAHMVDRPNFCSEFVLVRDFHGQEWVNATDVFRCSSVVAREYGPVKYGVDLGPVNLGFDYWYADWAVLEMASSPMVPSTVPGVIPEFYEGQPVEGLALELLGHPLGGAVKHSTGTLAEPTGVKWLSSLSAWPGVSGSPVFAVEGQGASLIGVMVEASPNFVVEGVGESVCIRLNQCDDRTPLSTLCQGSNLVDASRFKEWR